MEQSSSGTAVHLSAASEVDPIGVSELRESTAPKSTAPKKAATMIFVPFSEEFVERHGLSLGDLVPFHSQYTCVRLADSSAQYGWSDVEIEQPA